MNDVSGRLTALGPFFSVQVHPPGQSPAAPWRPLRELTSPSAALRARVDGVRATLAGRGRRDLDQVEPRVAASAVHLGLAARLVSPALGAAVLGRPLDLNPDGVWWQDVTGGPVPLSVPDQVPAGVSAWDLSLFGDLLAPLTEAVAAVVPLSPRVLWGNVASAVNTAARLVAGQRPDLAGAAWYAAGGLFASRCLSGERDPPGPAFRRSSCCLFYRLEPAGPPAVCGDCVLAGRPERR